MKSKISETSLRQIIQEELLNEMPRKRTLPLESATNTVIQLLDELLEADHLDDIEGTEVLIKELGSRIGAMSRLITKAKTRRARAQWTPEKRAEIDRKRAETLARSKEMDQRFAANRERERELARKKGIEYSKLPSGSQLIDDEWVLLPSEEKQNWTRVYDEHASAKEDRYTGRDRYYYIRK